MTRTYIHAYKDESRFFVVSLCVLAIALCSYAYFVSSSVMNVVMRKEVDQEITSLSSSLSNLEAQYIERQHMVSDSLAYERGYVAVSKKTFIPRGAEITVARLEN